MTLTTAKALEKLQLTRDGTLLGGGEKRIEAQHAKGKMTARERVNEFLDSGSFVEIDAFVLHNCQDFGMKNPSL